MPVDTIELLRAAEVVAEVKSIKVAAKESLKGAGLTFATTLAGGLLAGPVGIFGGAVLGGFTSMIASKGKFKSVVIILKDELTESQKLQLCNHLKNALNEIDVTDFIGLATLVMREEAVMLAVMAGIKKFLESNMQYAIV